MVSQLILEWLLNNATEPSHAMKQESKFDNSD